MDLMHQVRIFSRPGPQDRWQCKSLCGSFMCRDDAVDHQSERHLRDTASVGQPLFPLASSDRLYSSFAFAGAPPSWHKMNRSPHCVFPTVFETTVDIRGISHCVF